MAKPIIVGVDGSPTAAKAATVAAELAAALEAPLHVISAYEKEKAVAVQDGTDSWLLTQSSEAEATAHAVATRLRSASLDVESRAVLGKPDEAMVAEAKRVGARLIVVGNKRVQGVARVLGSIAGGVARHAPCDLYVAHTTD